jgi:MATE family multidrug resistance protein
MLLASALAACVFFALYLWLNSQMGNHALWLAFLSFLFVRGVVQTMLCGKVSKIPERS